MQPNHTFEKIDEVINWMYAKLPMYSQIGELAYNEGLHNITTILHLLGNPQNNYKTIHIAGTNGKGSTSHMLASVLQEQGYKVGLFTSPHLISFAERMRIDGKNCEDQFIIDFMNRYHKIILEMNLSFFELTTALSFAYFSDQSVDFGVIEVGLGGRLDATNIILPILSVITNVHYDHQNILGNTLTEIAFEKGGIIKPSIPLVLGEMMDEPKQKLLTLAMERKARVYEYKNQKKFISEDFTLDLRGNYQTKNKKTVLTALQVLKYQLGIKIDEEKIKKGLKKVVLNTNLRGRWEVLGESPLIICDTGHNLDGVSQIIDQILTQKYKQLHLVLGFVKDKDFISILNLFPKDSIFYFCEPNLSRKLPIEEIRQKVDKKSHAYYFHSVGQALIKAKQNATSDDFIFVGGSNFVVAEAIMPK